MPTWTTPANWTTDQLVTANDLNEQLRDNLMVLKDPPTVAARYTSSTPPAITSTSFVDIDATLNFQITTNGGRLLVGVIGRLYHYPGSTVDCYLDVNVDTVSEGGISGVAWLLGPNTNQFPFSFVWLTAAKTAGLHTVKIQCKRGGGNANPMQFYDVSAWVKEV